MGELRRPVVQLLYSPEATASPRAPRLLWTFLGTFLQKNACCACTSFSTHIMLALVGFAFLDCGR